MRKKPFWAPKAYIKSGHVMVKVGKVNCKNVIFIVKTNMIVASVFQSGKAIGLKLDTPEQISTANGVIFYMVVDW